MLKYYTKKFIYTDVGYSYVAYFVFIARKLHTSFFFVFEEKQLGQCSLRFYRNKTIGIYRERINKCTFIIQKGKSRPKYCKGEIWIMTFTYPSSRCSRICNEDLYRAFTKSMAFLYYISILWYIQAPSVTLPIETGTWFVARLTHRLICQTLLSSHMKIRSCSTEFWPLEGAFLICSKRFGSLKTGGWSPLTF